MMEFFDAENEPQVGGSGDDKPKNKPQSFKGSPLPNNKDSLKVKLDDDSGITLVPNRLPKLEDSSRSLDVNLDSDQFNKKFPESRLSDNVPKLLADRQTWYNQLGNLGARVTNNFFADVLTSIGATKQIGADVVAEMRNQDAEFSNTLMEWGDEWKQWAKKNFPNYRQNPNESWNVSDSAWWFDGIESAFTGLSFLVGGTGFVKGLGAVAKLTRAESALAKLGANVGRLKMASKIATSAAFMRNAENMMESYQVKKSVKDDLLNEWQTNPDSFKNLEDSEVAKDMIAEGRDYTPENLANYISGKAAWKAYAINSINIVFDALQVAPIFKGFTGKTRIAASSPLKDANRKLLNASAKPSNIVRRSLDYINPVLTGTGRASTEGIEELVNYIGTGEGKSTAAHLVKQDDSSFGDRMNKYLKSGDFWENGFWGTIGGGVFEAGAHAVGKISKFRNVSEANDALDYRMGEINERIATLQKAADITKKINEADDLTDEEKKNHINEVKSELALDLGLRASKTGNVDLLLEQIKSPEFKDKLVNLGITDDINADKAIAKTVDDVLLAEKLYKQYAGSFEYAKGSEAAKNSLIQENVQTDYFIRKREDKKNKLARELEGLKANDRYILDYKGAQLESLIQLEGLKIAKNSIQAYNNSSKEDLLTERGNKEIAKIDEKINQLKEQTKDEKLDLSAINEDILTKQAEIFLLEGVNSIQAEKVVTSKKDEAVTKRDEEIAVAQKKLEDAIYFNYEQDKNIQIDSAKTDEERKALLSDLAKEKSTATKDKRKTGIINRLTKKIEADIAASNIKNEIKDSINNEVQPEIIEERPAPVAITENGNPATNINDFATLPEFEVQDIDESQVNPAYKAPIDEFIKERNEFELQGLTGEPFYQVNPIEAQYARNKIQEARNEAKKKLEIAVVNTSLPTNDQVGFEFDEVAQIENEKGRKEKPSVYDLKNEQEPEDNSNITFLAKDIAQDTCTVFVPFFGQKFEDYFQINNGDILVTDEYADLIRTLFNPEFTAGADVEIVWDKANEYTQERWRGQLDNEAFKILYKGKPVAYLGTVDAVQFEIDRFRRKGLNDRADYLALDLVNIKKLRSQLKLDENAKWKTKISAKGNGTLITRGTRKADLRTLEGIFGKTTKDIELYALDAGDFLNDTRLVGLTNKEDSFSSVGSLRKGIIYGKLPDANGTPRPIPLNVAKVNLVQAKLLKDDIEMLLKLLNEGKHFDNVEVREVKERIERFIKVDRKENYDKAIGFRIFPQGTNEEGKTTDARVQMTFYSRKQDKMLTAVMKLSRAHGGSWVGLFDEQKNKIHPFNNTEQELSLDHPFFLEILQRKHQNIDFRLLGKNKSFEFDRKTYPSYKDYLIKEEVLQTDIAQVIDKEGKVLSNWFAFKRKDQPNSGSDFKLFIDTNIQNVSKEKVFTSEEEKLVDEILSFKTYDEFEGIAVNKKFDSIIRKAYNIEQSLVNDTFEDIQEGWDKFKKYISDLKEKSEGEAFLNSFTQKGFSAQQKSLTPAAGYEAELTKKTATEDDQKFKEKYSLFRNNKTTPTHLLNEILSSPKNDNIRDVATFLKSHIGRFPLHIVGKDKTDSGGRAAISYDKAHVKGEIEVNTKLPISEVWFQQVMLHELVHGVTLTQIASAFRNEKDFRGLIEPDEVDISKIDWAEGTPQHTKDFIATIISQREQVISFASKRYGKSFRELVRDTKVFYGLENPIEFVAEVMTNPNFRNEIRKMDENWLRKFYNSIIEFLKKTFGINLPYRESKKLKEAVNNIKDFVTRDSEYASPKFDVVAQMSDDYEFQKHFSREEQREIIRSLELVIANIYRTNKFEVNGEAVSITNERSIQDKVFQQYQEYLDSTNLPESVKTKANEVRNYLYEFFKEATNRLNKQFKKTSTYDLTDLEDSQEIVKSWNDKAHFSISSQETVTNQIKLFILSQPDINSAKPKTFDDKGNPIWDVKKSSNTGLPAGVDFGVVYLYLVRNLIGANGQADIIARLKTMGNVHPVFNKIAYDLEHDSNLLAQFDSNLAKKYIYDSYVTFIRNIEGQREIWTNNELKSTRYDYMIADEWKNKINSIIDNLDTSDKKINYESAGRLLLKAINEKKGKFQDHIDEITIDVQKFAAHVGVDLSYGVIKGRLETTSDWNNFEIIKLLGNVFGESILRGKKNNDYGRLNTLAKLEALVRFDVVENSGIDIKGNLIYAIRNPNFIANWFADAKADNEGSRNNFERKLKNIASTPEAQFYNYLWNDSTRKGFLNYETVNNKKVAKDVNWEFVKNFQFHNFGGAKEVTTRTAQDYGDFSDKDWMLITLINYIRPDEKQLSQKDRDFTFIPSLIPSDSSSMFNFEVPKIRLLTDALIRERNKKGSITKLSINKNSAIFEAVTNTNLQEINRIRQAKQQLFDTVDDKLVPRKDLDINDLQQYVHYGKSIAYNDDHTIDWNKTLLKEDGTPIGNAFYFQNMVLRTVGGLITLDDVDGIKTKNGILPDKIGTDILNKMVDFTQKFVNQQVSDVYNAYRNLETEVQGKHDKIVDGTYESLIAEYALNLYIGYVEQFNLFNGSIVEYKDRIDTNKRAKQMYSPGVSLSIEAMKITYENGNHSDGVSFKGVTLKDFKTSSNTFDYIAETIKNALIQDNPAKYIEHDLDFSIQNLRNKKPTNRLEKDVFSIVDKYLDINAGDAQGYITLDRAEQIIRGLGRWNSNTEKIFEKARKGENLNSLELSAIGPFKGFYYHREYNPKLNRLESNQIKYSSMVLIPQLVKGTELEKLMNWMNKNNVEEAFYESAHKVGAKNIYKIHNEDGTINDSVLNSMQARTYYNKNWELQLDVPEHLMDDENRLGTQITKLIITNLDPTSEYKINGISYNSENLLKHYFNLQDNNITEDAQELIDQLKAEIVDGEWIIKDRDIQRLLLDEVERRGLSDNYKYAIRTDEGGNFKLPLYVNNLATRWEHILTSIFTNRIVRQKLPGGSVALGSRLFLDKAIEQGESREGGNDLPVGIEWSKEKAEDRTLRSYRDENGFKVVEVLLSAWSSELFYNKQRISIDSIPDEVKTMVGYRIPTTDKAYMTVFKVVGFLPEANRGIIITPDDMVTQMGQDFDIDKWFINRKEFYNIDGQFIVPELGKENEEYKQLRKELKHIRKITNTEEIGISQAENDLAEDLLNAYGINTSIDKALVDAKDDERKILKRLRQLTNKSEDGKYSLKKNGSRQSRNNEIVSIWQTILTHPSHLREVFTPSAYPSIDKLANRIDTIYGVNDNKTSVTTEEGQRAFRKRNLTGKSLVAIAANLNAFGAIAQISKMRLNEKSAFKFKYDLSKYSETELKTRYKDDYLDDGVIMFRHLGYAPDGSYLNVNGELILSKGSEGVIAFVDNAKDPKADKINLTPYTYPLYHTGILAGVNPGVMGMFVRQPIIKMLNDYFVESKSLLGDTSGNEIEIIKRYYQTILLEELIKQGKKAGNEKTQKALDRRKKEGISNSFDKSYLIRVIREETNEVLGYNPDQEEIFSQTDLEDQLKLNAKGWSNLTPNERTNYLYTQLKVLESFNKHKKTAESVQDLLRVTKTDSVGAGPTMETTSTIVRGIKKIENRDDILIDGIPAIQRIYPSFFRLKEESAFKPLESYLNGANLLSTTLLNKHFISQTPSFKNVSAEIIGTIKRGLNEDELRNLNNFLNVAILQNFPVFKGIVKEETLGVGKEFTDNIEIPIAQFRNLSAANKISIMKEKMKDLLKDDTQHILNFLSPERDMTTLKEDGYHKIKFTFYKNEAIDDNLTDSLLEMGESGDEFQVETAAAIVEYAYVAYGLSFGRESFAKIIPNQTLVDAGLGDYLRQIHPLANNGVLFDNNVVDKFYRNNWNNSRLVPRMRTKWNYLPNTTVQAIRNILTEEGIGTDPRTLVNNRNLTQKLIQDYKISGTNLFEIAQGKKNIVRKNDEGQLYTKDFSPIWDARQDIIIVNEKGLKNLDSTTDKKSAYPYITIWSKEGIQLYKKFETLVGNEIGEFSWTNSFNGNVYFYKVSRLGKDNILEYTDKSMFEEHNTQTSERRLKQQIVDIINKTSEKGGVIALENTSIEKQDQIKKDCGYGN